MVHMSQEWQDAVAELEDILSPTQCTSFKLTAHGMQGQKKAPPSPYGDDLLYMSLQQFMLTWETNLS